MLKTRSTSTNVHDDRSQSTPAPRLLYVVSEDWYFLSHRLPMARAARDHGFEVHVVTRVKDGAAAIAAERFILHPMPFARGRLSPLSTLSTIVALRRLHRTIAPALTHHVSLQASVLGLIATFDRSAASVNAITGLGYSFTSNSPKAQFVRSVIGSALRFLLDRNSVVSLVQNEDDRTALIDLGVPKSRIALIEGSGVDVSRFAPLPEPQGPPTAVFVGRLLDDKGVRTLVAAHRLLRARGSEIRTLIAGAPDPANPASVTEKEAAAWNNEPGVTWLGHVHDISGLWARAHIAVLPSRREGLPLSLLEAAACGRAMVATDVPGCREIVIAGETGLLVPVDNVSALADAMSELFCHPQRRQQFAVAARQLVENRFSADIVGRQIVALYRRLLSPLQH